MLLTKYCSPKVQKALLRGEMWLGSHLKYKSEIGSKPTNGLMSDGNEGKVEHIISTGSIGATGIRIGQQKISNIQIYGGSQGQAAFSFAEQSNEFLFCTSLGGYNNCHHEKMMWGCKKFPDYIGEPKNSCYVVYELEQLVSSLLKWAQHSYEKAQIRHRQCIYGNREYEISEDEKCVGLTENYKSIFTKPEQFAIENEYRLALIIPTRRPTIQDDVLKLKCSATVAAIVEHNEFRA